MADAVVAKPAIECSGNSNTIGNNQENNDLLGGVKAILGSRYSYARVTLPPIDKNVPLLDGKISSRTADISVTPTNKILITERKHGAKAWSSTESFFEQDGAVIDSRDIKYFDNKPMRQSQGINFGDDKQLALSLLKEIKGLNLSCPVTPEEKQ